MSARARLSLTVGAVKVILQVYFSGLCRVMKKQSTLTVIEAALADAELNLEENIARYGS